MASTLDHMLDQVRENRIWRSIFRSGTGESNLHRALFVQQNVFLHLFSIKARKRTLEFSATWYLGALTFGTFLILVITGILLMLYYHPSVPQAYADMKDLQFVVSSGVFLRNLHRWSAHAMVFLVFAHMFKVFYRGAYRSAARVQLGHWRGAAPCDAALELYGLPAAVGPALFLGGNSREQYRIGGTRHGGQDPVPDAGRNGRERQRIIALLCPALCRPSVGGDCVHRDPFLAYSQRRRNLSR